MSEFDVDTTWLDDLAGKLEGMTSKELPQIERAGLRGVNTVIKPALVAATPTASQVSTELSTALPIGKLKGSVRARVLEPSGDLGRAAVVDFGRYSYVAHYVDGGHALVKGGRKGKGGREIKHIAARPFVRAVQDTMQEEAQEAMVTGADTEIDRILSNGT